MTTTAFALAAFCLIVPGHRRHRPGHRGDPRRRELDRRGLQIAALVTVTAICFETQRPFPAAVTAVLASPAVAAAIGRLHDRGLAGKHTITARETPVTLTLIAAALRAGAPLPTAVELAAPAADSHTRERLEHVVGLLRLGASPAQAWQDDDRDQAWSTISRAARQSAQSGVRVASAFDQLAADLRELRRIQGTVRAERAAVFAVAPLGLCFLPAFICIGVVPVVIGICTNLGVSTN